MQEEGEGNGQEPSEQTGDAVADAEIKEIAKLLKKKVTEVNPEDLLPDENQDQ